MRRDLTQPIRPVAFPAGVSAVAFDAANAAACRDLLNAAYEQGFGDVVPFEHWWPMLTADPEYDVDLCFVAVRSSAIVGFCQC